MVDRVIDATSWIWGEADSMYDGQANSFYQWENIEVRKNLNGFQLSAMLEDTWWVFDDDINYMVDLDTLWVSTWGIVCCLENGKIYLNGVLKETINTGTNAHNRVIGIWVNEASTWIQYVYYITETSLGQGRIHRSTTDLATFDIEYRQFETSSLPADKCTVINTTGLLYIFINDRVFVMENIEVVQEFLAIWKTEEIMYAYEYAGKYRIYANNWDTGIEYTWDWFAEAPSARQEFKSKPFLWGTSEWPFAYMVTWFNENHASLLRFPWLPYEELRINLEASPDSRVFGGYLSVRDSIVYISWGKTGQSNNYWIYTYWNYFPWTKKSLTQSYSLSSDRFTFHAHNSVYSYFACRDNKVYRIEHNNPPATYASEWYVDTLVYKWWMWEDMFYKVSKMAFDLNGWQVELYARTSFWTSDIFVLLTTLDNATYWSKKKAILLKSELVEEAIAEFGEFTEIQFRIKIIRGASQNRTPVFKRKTTLLTINENNNGNG